MLRVAEVDLAAIAPMTQTREHRQEALPHETELEYELRTWPHKLYATVDGHIYVPKVALQRCVNKVAASEGLLEAGNFIVLENLVTEVRATSVEGQHVFVSRNGQHDGKRKVQKVLPQIAKWAGRARFVIPNGPVTEEQFEKCLTWAGLTVGLGSGRPENGGSHGRFIATRIEWKRMTTAQICNC